MERSVRSMSKSTTSESTHKVNEPKMSDAFLKSKESDLMLNDHVPECLYWTCEQVGEYFARHLELPEYRETLLANRIDGRRLIYLDASHLPKLGIHDFEHIKKITQNIREILQMNAPYWNRSISLLPRDIDELYYEAKSISGQKSDKLNHQSFIESTADCKWQPPLTNQGLILPRF